MNSFYLCENGDAEKFSDLGKIVKLKHEVLRFKPALQVYCLSHYVLLSTHFVVNDRLMDSLSLIFLTFYIYVSYSKHLQNFIFLSYILTIASYSL